MNRMQHHTGWALGLLLGGGLASFDAAGAEPNAQMQAALDKLAALSVRPVSALSVREARAHTKIFEADAYKHFRDRDDGWAKVVLKPAA